MIALNSKGAIEHTHWKVVGIEFYNAFGTPVTLLRFDLSRGALARLYSGPTGF